MGEMGSAISMWLECPTISSGRVAVSAWAGAVTLGGHPHRFGLLIQYEGGGTTWAGVTIGRGGAAKWKEIETEADSVDHLVTAADRSVPRRLLGVMSHEDFKQVCCVGGRRTSHPVQTRHGN